MDGDGLRVCEVKVSEVYRGASLIRKHLPLGPYNRAMPRALGRGAVSYTRGTPVGCGKYHSEAVDGHGLKVCEYTVSQVYRGTSLERNGTPQGPHRRPVPRVEGES